MNLVSGVELNLDPIVAAFDPAILTHFMAKNWPKRLQLAKLAISRPGGSKLVDQRGSRLDQVQAHPGRCDGQFTASRMAIGGRHRASKRPEMAINGHIVAISRPGGPKLVDQRGSRLDLVRAHPGRCVATYSRVRNGHRGAP